MNKTIKLATYNIQFCLHSEEVISNILLMVADGVAIICLQEVVEYEGEESVINQLLSALGDSWRAVCHLGDEKDLLGVGNCILWNRKIFSIKSKHLELLPYSHKLSFHEKGFSLLAGGLTKPFKRRIVIAEFTIESVRFHITNIHLDHNGGMNNRLKQLTHITKLLSKIRSIDKEIICGDFNCFDLLNNGDELESYQKLFGPDYQEATAGIDWTGDLYDIDTSKGNKMLERFIKRFNIHVKRKLDYIWVKNVKANSCKKLDLKGSDHKPIVVSIQF